jgi:hypothetical protein
MTMKTEYQTHPAADVFPMMSPAEFDALCKSIAKNGLNEPIVIVSDDDPRIIDGRNRYAACKKTGVTPIFNTLDDAIGRKIDGDIEQLIIEFVKIKNVHRRHLTEWEKYLQITTGTTKALPGDNQHIKKGLLKNNRPQTHAETAEKMKVSPAKARQLAYIKENDFPEIIEQLKADKITVGNAYKMTKEKKKQIQHMLDGIASEFNEIHQTPTAKKSIDDNNAPGQKTVKESQKEIRKIEKYEQITRATTQLEKVVKLLTGTTSIEVIKSESYVKQANKKRPPRTHFFRDLKETNRTFEVIQKAGAITLKNDRVCLEGSNDENDLVTAKTITTKQMIEDFENVVFVIQRLLAQITLPQSNK